MKIKTLALCIPPQEIEEDIEWYYGPLAPSFLEIWRDKRKQGLLNGLSTH